MGEIVAARPIRILPPEEARRIAAGEVIDRPAALIREFLDNAIDAGASNIEVFIEEGGSKKVEVADDGKGMTREDMEICWLDHATSKIRSLDDLKSAETLGFRGEALAAAATVARLEIVSSTGGGVPMSPWEAWRLEVGPGGSTTPRLTAVSRTRGSTVRALNLYDTIPARKHFLKRESAEGNLCRQVFIDKALAFPGITFRLTQDGKNKHFFPAVESKKERFIAAVLDTRERDFLYQINVMGNGFSAEVVIGGPEVYRMDRRMLYIFANGRRLQDFSLITAMEYGTQGLFPNGAHPVGAVYIQIDPALADFNIHPAKREARFKDPGAIHHAISSGLRDFYHSLGFKNLGLKTGNSVAYNAPPRDSGTLALEALFEKTSPSATENASAFWKPGKTDFTPIEAAEYVNTAHYGVDDWEAPLDSIGGENLGDAGIDIAETSPSYNQIRYVGKAFGFFIVAEWGNKLFIIDQHAAHERILYNRFLSAPIPKQELLIPIFFATESLEDDRFLEEQREELAQLAIVIEPDEGGWQITALPEGWSMSDTETIKEILNLRTANENIATRWAATLCCHQALREGDVLDDKTALDLAKEALALPEPRCPHGRPIWTEISREALCKAVRRSQ